MLGADRRLAPRHELRQPVEIHSEFAGHGKIGGYSSRLAVGRVTADLSGHRQSGFGLRLRCQLLSHGGHSPAKIGFVDDGGLE